MGCVEVFMNLKKERYFKNILLFFNEKDLSLEIEFNSNDKKLNKKILWVLWRFWRRWGEFRYIL